MKKNHLFRFEVIQKRITPKIGSILLVRPTSFLYISVIACACAASIIIFLILGSYSMRSVANGQLLPLNGVVKVMPPMASVILENHITEGQHVNKGDVLFVVSADKQYNDKSFSQAAISNQLLIRKQSLIDDLTRTTSIHIEQEKVLRRQIDNLGSSLLKLEAQLHSKQARLMLSEKTVNRFQELFQQHYISDQQLQEKQADLLDEKAAQQALERDYVSSQREIEDAKDALVSLPMKQSRELEAIKRAIVMVEQDLIDSEGRRQTMVAAPVSGIATTLMSEIGQTVEPGRALMNIVPDQSLLEARLYVPSKSIGFVKPGDVVMLRYQAYPYQKFGQAKGTVKTVGRVAVSLGELGTVGSGSGVTATEPVYAVTVKLEKQTIMAYGHNEVLMAGMQLEGDILHESRHLLEWILDPIYTITGRM